MSNQNQELLFAPLEEWEAYRDLREAAQKAQVSAAHGMAEGQKAYLAAALHRDTGRPLVIVTANDVAAGRMAEDLAQMLDVGVGTLPGREVSLYRAVAASHELSARRLESLHRMRTGDVRILVASADALMHRLMPVAAFDARVFTLAEGQRMPLAELTERLLASGYTREDMVEGKGQFALRGGILDVFPPAALSAVRVEFFDDEVDSIRTFDVLTQRSQTRITPLVISPADEALIDPADAMKVAARLMSALKESPDAAKIKPHKSDAQIPALEPIDSLDGDWEDDELPGLWDMPGAKPKQAKAQASDSPTKAAKSAKQANAQSFTESAKIAKVEAQSSAKTPAAPSLDRLAGEIRDIADALREGRQVRNLDRWMHLLFPEAVTALAYFDDPIVLLDEPDRLRERCENRMLEFVEQYTTALERGEALPSQSELLLDWDALLPLLTRGSVVTLSSFLRTMGGIAPRALIKMESIGGAGYQSQLRDLAHDVARWQADGHRVVLLSGGAARGQRLAESLLEAGAIVPFVEEHEKPLSRGEAVILPLILSHGFQCAEAKLVILSDTEIFGVAQKKARARKRSGEKIAAFTDLKVGDYVVHESHGVGIYQGTIRLQSEGTYRDYLYIQYQGSDKLYVPTDQLDRVQKYIGAEKVAPHINRLGGSEWQKQKAKVKQSIKTLAFDLVRLYAQRQEDNGFAYAPDTPWQRQFEENFPFEETPDQLQSIEEIKGDMQRKSCMDRLLCGDVGYGKTEVALRAAFKAVMDGKQVALLSPTTILAQQHYNTIVKRFDGFPVQADVISRFRTAAEQKQVLRNALEGKVDILVGTHRLLNKDVMFKDLGLLIVDEEQRFGVAHKESIKNLKKNIDVLTLSATPIPRTLHMSMVGIRDMSVLETPPEERYPVQTYVVEYQDGMIRDAILREIARQGQVYFLYNRVESIEKFHQRLCRLVPEARIAIGHGQMREHALEDVMMDFYERKYDVLLCTTIIESGLDIPLANTMIVFDADRFGLSQLYQLRGRVGRSNRLAYAYLTVRPNKVLTETAQKRLEAIREFTEFGSGFRIAMRDLELRGAGNILGPEQSGQMAAVGYDMYVKLIEETVREIRGEIGESVDIETRVELQVDAFLPTEYVHGEYQRIEIYKRIASIEDSVSRTDVEEELVDRFGDEPNPVINLVAIAHLKAMCSKLGIESVVHRTGQLVMKFSPHAHIDGARLFLALHETDRRLSLSPQKPPSLILRDPRLEAEDMLHESVRLMEAVTAKMETLVK